MKKTLFIFLSCCTLNVIADSKLILNQKIFTNTEEITYTDFKKDKLIDKVISGSQNIVYINKGNGKYKKIIKKFNSFKDEDGEFPPENGTSMSAKDNFLEIQVTYPIFGRGGADYYFAYYFYFNLNENNEFILIKTEYETLEDFQAKNDATEVIKRRFILNAPFLKDITLSNFDNVILYNKFNNIAIKSNPYKPTSKYFKLIKIQKD